MHNYSLKAKPIFHHANYHINYHSINRIILNSKKMEEPDPEIVKK